MFPHLASSTKVRLEIAVGLVLGPSKIVSEATTSIEIPLKERLE